MKTVVNETNWGLILLSIFGIVITYWALWSLWQEWKEGKKETPNDALYDLDWKIDNAILDYHSELYFINRIKELKQHPEIDQERLYFLDMKFKQRFQELHLEDEYNPGFINDRNAFVKKKLHDLGKEL